MSDQPSRDIWLDAFARRFGFGWLAARIPGSPPPSYVYAVAAVVGGTAVTLGYNLATGIPTIYAENPYFALLPVGLLGAVYAARSLSHSYDRAMADMRVEQRTDEPGPLLTPIPSWVPWALFGVGAMLQLIRTALAWDAYAISDIIANAVLFPFVYTPIVAQFFVVYLGIQVVGPWRLSRSEVGIHFLDAEGVGGLRPLGELIKRAYYAVGLLLIAGALITYAPFVDTGWSVIPFANALFTGVWVVSIATVGFAVATLHRFMYREKREAKERLEQELLDRINEPWDVSDYEIPESEADAVATIQERIQRVSATREYPATFSIWSQLIIGIVVPKAIQFVLANA